jgi:ABC-type transporter Mla MlaB component
MKTQALQYYMHDGSTAFRFELAGELNYKGASELDQAWRTASSVIGDRKLNVDITFVTSVDGSGRALLARWHREGAQIIANSPASRVLAESILGESASHTAVIGRAAAATDLTWLPFHTSFFRSAAKLLIFAAFWFAADANAATLKSETVTAWDDYIRTASANVQTRVRPGGSFLWSFQDAERAANVRGGEIFVASATGQHPKKVPGGLIHHWIGAVFLPGLTLNKTLDVTRDYDRYKEFYRPFVMDSKAVSRNGSDDNFSMVLINKVLFLKTALDADYQSTTVQLDERHVYSASRTTRLQEIVDLGEPGEHILPEGEGVGYIWKLFSIARFEQHEDGVYVELEAIALSRDIPAAVRFMAEPIVRRVSRNSLLTSLQQTEKAARGVDEVAKSAGFPASAKNARGIPPTSSHKGSAFTAVH